MPDRIYYTYIVASPSRTLYIGLTSNLETRIYQHKSKEYKGFSATYGCNRLVFFEHLRKPRNRHQPRKATQRLDTSEENNPHRAQQPNLDRPE